MNPNAPMMTETPASVEEAWRWIDSLLGRQPHGRSAWDIEQDIKRVRDLCRWIREQTDSLLPLERLFAAAVPYPRTGSDPRTQA